jgi:hypothetical protein
VKASLSVQLPHDSDGAGRHRRKGLAPVTLRDQVPNLDTCGASNFVARNVREKGGGAHHSYVENYGLVSPFFDKGLEETRMLPFRIQRAQYADSFWFHYSSR